MSTHDVVSDDLGGDHSLKSEPVIENSEDPEIQKDDQSPQQQDLNLKAAEDPSLKPELKPELKQELSNQEGFASDVKIKEEMTDKTEKEPLATPEPTIPVKKKRLTLQERLALAANKGGKKPLKKAKESSAEATPRTSIDTQDRSSMEVESTTTDGGDEFETDDEISLLPTNYEELDHSALLNVLKEGLDKFSIIMSLLKKQKSLNQEFKLKLSNKETELRQKDAKVQELLKMSSENSSSAITKKLLEKENIIKELMEEGSKLSMKELTLSNTIKKLKSKSNEDSELLNSLQEKLDSTSEKLASFELKEVELKEFDAKREQLTSDLQSLETKLQKSQEDYAKVSQQYKDLKSQRFEQQLESTKLKLEDELKKNKDLSLQVDDLNIRLKLVQDQSRNELAELEEKLRKERRRYQSLQEDNANEIKRLEDKMELLRIMTESSSSSKSDDTANESFKKLAASNELLQSQYTLAQENWKFIESSYLNKLSQAEQDINILKQKDLTAMKKIKVLSSDLKAKNEELEEVLEKEGALVSEIATIKKLMQDKDEQIDELKKIIESLKQEISAIKLSAEKELKDELAKQRDTFEKEIDQVGNKSFDGPLQQQGLYLNDLLPNPSFLKTRSVSNMSWNDNIAFGESSTTPRSSHATSRMPSSSVLNQFGNPLRTPLGESNPRFFESPREVDSQLSYDQHGDDSYFEEEFSEDYNNTTANSPNSQISSKFTLHRESISGGGGGVNNKHVQIIGKLSSQIRRIEIESLTLKDEIASLKKEKNESNDEIVRLLKENSEANELKTERDALQKRVNELDKKYQKTLELLGEKSERVEELKADVADLKELCREQVQQLVALQSR